jgi:hypothetical protein
MRNFRRHRFLLSFVALLVFCSVMVIRQFGEKQSKHVELREALILLHSRGYNREAERLFERLLRDVPKLSDKNLLDDFQRTRILVDPFKDQPDNVMWKYHWVVSNELEKRAESTLKKALKLAEEN